jgi:hypothetical protein
MPKRYVVVANDGTYALSATTQASGSLVHLVDGGPTLGRQLRYSGAVIAPVVYYVDNDVTFGEERSAT